MFTYWLTVVLLLILLMMNQSLYFLEKNFNPNDDYILLADGSRTNNVAMKEGIAKLYLQDTDGNMHGIYLQNALYATS